ncbi:potassium-transporting ATPase subunit F [Deinococcus misasensis]
MNTILLLLSVLVGAYLLLTLLRPEDF